MNLVKKEKLDDLSLEIYEHKVCTILVNDIELVDIFGYDVDDKKISINNDNFKHLETYILNIQTLTDKEIVKHFIDKIKLLLSIYDEIYVQHLDKVS